MQRPLQRGYELRDVILGRPRLRGGIEAVECPGVDVQLGRHPGANEAAGIIDVFLGEEIERADCDECRRERGKITATS